MRDIAIVGAGAAGAAAAYALRESGDRVTVFEKSRGVTGRAATRRRDDCRYDHGANYVKSDDGRVNDLLTSVLDTEGLVDVEEPVYAFEADGTISEGRDADEHKWTYTEGLTQLGKRLFATADATVEHATRVCDVTHESEEGRDRWTLADADGEGLGTFDALLLTPPAPQTAELLSAMSWDDDRRARVHDAVASVEYVSIVTAVLHYPFPTEYPWYAAVNTDKDHPVGWLSREECKDGHVPEGESLLIAQMGQEWSAERIDDDSDEVVAEAVGHVAELLGEGRFADPDWTDYQGWRYAQPKAGVEGGAHLACEDASLYFAGDWVAGEGRVHAALRNGLEVGERIADGDGE
ncbi:NAD(P)/FAD-dependent oxidoreductase [Halomarina litorea]|uniref:NAD(P)/FAD-dependent oxidoreductase n=1 Tax=Halomarina litorea TaxID=2961595 RepID=UPI0020C4825B|nr:FAD-dependent oxidoreductase [Halomarina sp. BCD28]